MSQWTAGYVADVGYTYGYYAELNPLHARLALLNAGLAVPAMGHACELGFGQGMSANIHAAASSTRWFGTDFNPAQAAFAQELATVSGAGAQLFDDAFADFARRPELPEFDYIGLHGIWSWISDENRGVIVDFVRRKLKVGGVLYISYNTLPGWAAFAPMRHLLTQHAVRHSAPGQGIVNRIDNALGFAEKLLATNPAYARANPQVAERVKKIKDQNRHYLAHEYFNRDWHPMHFATMADWLEPAKLEFACSANYLDHVELLNLTADQQALLAEMPDASMRQSVRDFMVNQQFRKDLWVRGARRLAPYEQATRLRETRVVLTVARAEVALKVSGALGEATLSEAIYTPLLDALADNKPRTIGQLEESLRAQGVNFSQLLQAVMVLAGAGSLAQAQEDKAIAEARKRTDRLNAHYMLKARGSADVAYLASPVTGGAVAVGRFVQLFLLARSQGLQQPSQWVASVWALLQAQGQRLVRQGQALQTDQENIDELQSQADALAQKQLPVLRALQVV